MDLFLFHTDAGMSSSLFSFITILLVVTAVLGLRAITGTMVRARSFCLNPVLLFSLFTIKRGFELVAGREERVTSGVEKIALQMCVLQFGHQKDRCFFLQ